MEKMKVARILALAAVATLAVTSMSFAGGAVWFEAMPAPSTGGSSVVGQGAPGASTTLECDISTGLRCEWLITIHYTTNDGGQGGWSLDLSTPGLDGKFNIKGQPQFSGDVLNNAGTAVFGLNEPRPGPNNGFGDATLLINSMSGATTTPPAGPGDHILGSFVLSKNKLPGELNTSFIYANVGVLEFGGDDDAGYEVITLGGNDPQPGQGFGFPYYVTPNAVITVRNTPEPATLGLVGLGVLAFARRRK
jgi:hypothetical protein